MLFTTDKQTLDDLNIFGRHGGDSIYNIFNRCCTKGGAAILEDMFRYPLSDFKAIRKRSGIIAQFAAAGTAFPFESADFDIAESYLANIDERSQLAAHESSFARKITNIIAVDIETQLIYKGVVSLVALIKKLHGFINEVNQNEFYSDEREEIIALISDNSLVKVLESNGRLQHADIADLDVILRFKQRTLIEKLLRLLYHLDVYVSVARVAVERNFEFPAATIGDQHQLLELEGVYHPLVKNAVPNSIVVSRDSNVIFLTGANMAGKSTFMKSLSIAMYLGHLGFPVPAKRMTFTVLDGVYTTINLPDNLGLGASHFYAEVLRVKKMAQELAARKRLFIVFDELFRGTNVKDAYEATIAITAAFAKKAGSIFVISTHIIEAGEVLKSDCPNVNFVYLPTRMNGNQPLYTYTLQNGITGDRHGMVIINNEKIIEILKNGKKQLQKETLHELHNG